MAKVFIQESTLTAIGNAIRNKNGSTELIDPVNMATAIDSIETGGGGGDLPPEALHITGNCSNRFANNGWNWFIDEYGNQITTENISDTEQMFKSSSALTAIPFEINLKYDNYGTADFANMFMSCQYLRLAPKIRGNINWNYSIKPTLTCLFKDCKRLRDAEDVFTLEMFDGCKNVKITSAYTCVNTDQLFYGCTSLRQLPSWFYQLRLNEESTVYPSSGNFSYNISKGCNALDEMVNLPVYRCTAAQTNSMFGSTYANPFQDVYRLKNLTFETDNGTPYVVKWKSQTIDVSQNCGNGPNRSTTKNVITNYNSGITADKEVYDDATYQALKNDPDWFSGTKAYSRYNHDSAVATINSLPDTSAYLAEAGGTNTIRFNGEAGSSTDGGAINTLTEQEIAVAAAKGWTVTL